MFPKRPPADDALLSTLLQRLQLFFQSAGVSQSEVARKIGYSQSNISNWFNPKRDQEPRLLPIVKIALCYGLNLSWLVSGEGPMFGAGEGATRAGVQGGLDAVAQVDQAVRQIRRDLESQFSRIDGDEGGGSPPGVPLGRAEEAVRQARRSRPRPTEAGRRALRGR